MGPTRRRVLAATGVAATLGVAAQGWRFARRDVPAREVPPLPAGRRAGAPALDLRLVLTDPERQDLPPALPLPAHERLRERGTSVTRFHVNTTPCSPSRSNLDFGQHTPKTRRVVNRGVHPEPEIPPAMPSLRHSLRANGYRTAYQGRWHLSELRAHHELTDGRYPNSCDAFEASGEAARTIVVFASDHGELAGTSLAAAVADPAARTERDRRGHLFDDNTTHDIDGAFRTQLGERGVTADRHRPLAALRAGMRPLPRLDRPELFRGIHVWRYKSARDVKPSEHHRPLDWATLTRQHPLELYDLQADPLEMNHLAHDPEPMKPLVTEINRKLDALIATEVGEDLGDERVGPAFAKRL